MPRQHLPESEIADLESSTAKTSDPLVVLAYDGYSDADEKHRPTGAQWMKCDPEFVERVYLTKIAQKYMEESGQAEVGKRYQLDRLPAGYELWTRSRNDGKTWDRFCYGHPNHGQFNSPFDFYPHFKYLMQYDGEDGVCECRFCNSGKSVRKGAGSRSSTKSLGSNAKPSGIRGRPPLQRGPVDEEGTSNVITRLLSILHTEGHIDRKIEERSNMDWRVESVIYEGAKESIALQASFVPRVGELVLFYRGVNDACNDPASGELKIWNEASKTFSGHPDWLAGVITQVPIPAEPVHLDDIMHETSKRHNVNSSGFRIECYPNPNNEDKNLSKQYNYVPMHHIRPMVFCDDILKGISPLDWHPTIQNAMTAMASVSCVSRYKMKGIWPNFSMFCEGLFVGSELLRTGEPIRLMPRGKETVVIDVMVPTCFVVRVEGLDPDKNGIITPEQAKRMRLLVIGHIYTMDHDASENGITVKDPSTLPTAMQGYGPWYHKSGPNDSYETSFTYILGRLYEYEAIQKWFNGITTAKALNIGMLSTRTARVFAASNRIDRSGAHLGWYWTEDRASSLDIATFNGIEVGEYNKEREPKKWREVLAVLDGLKDRVVEPVAASSSNAGTSSSSSGFVAVNQNRRSSLLNPPLPQDDTEDELAKGMADNVINVDDYDDVIDDLIAGEGFPEEGQDSAAPAAKRPRME